MKINNETKVGILAIVAVALLIWGFNFLKGSALFKKTTHFYAIFPSLEGLDKSNEVKINGLTIGNVSDFNARDKKVSSIIVTINLIEDVNIPNNSVAHISSGFPLGSASITINVGDANDYLKDGDTIRTVVNVGILSDLNSQVGPTLNKARDAIDSLKIVLGGMNRLFDPGTKGNIQAIIANLAITSVKLQTILEEQSKLLAESIGNVNSITGNLAQNNGRITTTLENLETTTSKFAKLDLERTIDTLNQTVNSLKSFAGKLNSNEGSLGLLVSDKTLYNNLNYTAVKLETLIDDIRVNPKRYVNISVFGGKNKGAPITSPQTIDTLFRIGNK